MNRSSIAIYGDQKVDPQKLRRWIQQEAKFSAISRIVMGPQTTDGQFLGKSFSLDARCKLNCEIWPPLSS
jgi:hypothetical protein